MIADPAAAYCSELRLMLMGMMYSTGKLHWGRSGGFLPSHLY